MASGFPGAIDNFSDPLANSPLNSPSHATLHSDVNDAVEKIETYMGLVKVIPTAVTSSGGTSATLAANGTITIGSGNTSITIINCWSSLYDNYRLEIDLYSGGSTSTVLCQLRTASTTTTTNYKGVLWTPFVSYTSGAAASQTSTTALVLGYNESSGGSLGCDVFGPFLSRQTKTIGSYTTDANAGFTGSVQTDSTSFVSAILSLGSGSYGGGSIRIYGYRN